MLCLAHVSTQMHTHFSKIHCESYCFTAGPPSAPQNIAVSNVTNTSVFIMWEAPEDDGNRTDLFYTISHNVTVDIFNTTSTNITLTGLIPFVSYELRVTADNGVSSQDDDNIDIRTVTISIMTEGGGICVCVCFHECV